MKLCISLYDIFGGLKAYAVTFTPTGAWITMNMASWHFTTLSKKNKKRLIKQTMELTKAENKWKEVF